MRVKKLGVAGLASVLFLLAGCETTEGYRQHMDMNVGQTGDSIQIQWGVPDQKSTLSDGSELWVYHRVRENRSGGYWSNRSRSRTEYYTDSDGKKRSRTVTYSEPYYEPEVVTHTHCETRFVVGKDNMVKSVGFEGDGCVAEEIEKKEGAPAA